MKSAGREAELDLVIAARTTLARDVVRLDLADPAGGPLPGWQPGAHIDVLLGPGMIRQYSLCGDPADRGTWRIAVLRENAGRGGSRLLHDTLGPGSVLATRGPRNHFPLEPAGRYLFVAGGIGITPIVPMIAAADAAAVPWTLVYGGRSRSSMAFAAGLAARHPGRVELRPQDETGLLDLEALLGRPAHGTAVYCCGPESLIAAVESGCGQAGWDPAALHVERFVSRPRAQPAGPASFEIELARSGVRLVVPPEVSILKAVEAAGVAVLSSCTEGTCGTCETSVLDGTPEHRDSVLTTAERAAADVMMICVSRSMTPRLVLDL